MQGEHTSPECVLRIGTGLNLFKENGLSLNWGQSGLGLSLI